MANRVRVRGCCAALVLLLIAVTAAGAADRPDHAPALVVHRSLDAVVSKVEPETGVILVKTDAGRLTLHGLRNVGVEVRRGDPVLVDVAVIRHPEPSRLPRSEVPAHAFAMERLDAEIAAINRGLGIVALRTPAGRLDVELPSTAIEGLRTGDHVPVEIAVFEETGVAASARSEPRGPRRGLAEILWALFGRLR